jgi:hypothetical protein
VPVIAPIPAAVRRVQANWRVQKLILRPAAE